MITLTKTVRNRKKRLQFTRNANNKIIFQILNISYLYASLFNALNQHKSMQHTY